MTVDRRRHYLDVALRLFGEHGFPGVSMDQLVTEAGGSKATLYRYFPSKEALFEALIEDVVATTQPPEDPELAGVTLAEGLRRIGTATAAAACNERTIALLRLALGEHSRFPQLSRTLFEHGPARSYARLVRFLEQRQRAGEVEITDFQIAAEQFLGGIVGHQQLRMALGVSTPSARDLDARVDSAVRWFVSVYGTSNH
jgi:AcrR family transcriptional regulator